MAFRSPDSHESQNDIQERKLDKLCCLVEKLVESHSQLPVMMLLAMIIWTAAKKNMNLKIKKEF